jgi:hypothetical protein
MLTPVSPGRPSPLAWVQARCRAYARLVRWGRERTQELPPPFIVPALSEGCSKSVARAPGSTLCTLCLRGT